MEIVCTSCKSKLRVPDLELPPGKSASLRCPKCNTKIHLGSETSQSEAPSGDPANQIMETESTPSEDLMQESFELARLGGKTALICEPHTAARDKLVAMLESMKYFTVKAEDTRNALKRMRYHLFDLAVINEDFDAEDPDTNGVLIYLRHVEMSVRRHMFVVMISKRFRSLDQLTAMNKSVNLIVNNQHIDNLENILSRSMADNKQFYDVYMTSMKKLGKM